MREKRFKMRDVFNRLEFRTYLRIECCNFVYRFRIKLLIKRIREIWFVVRLK